MGFELRILRSSARLVSVPKPIALRYVVKDEQGHTQIQERTPPAAPPAPPSVAPPTDPKRRP